jgi:hypothetical protein
MDARDLPSFDDVHPVTIVDDRYGGTYSGGRWCAFPSNPQDVPPDPSWDDSSAAGWWADAEGLPVGRGDTPDLAYADLVRRLETIPPDEQSPPSSRLGQTIWKWNVTWPSGQQALVIRMWRGDGQGPLPS